MKSIELVSSETSVKIGTIQRRLAWPLREGWHAQIEKCIPLCFYSLNIHAHFYHKSSQHLQRINIKKNSYYFSSWWVLVVLFLIFFTVSTSSTSFASFTTSILFTWRLNKLDLLFEKDLLKFWKNYIQYFCIFATVHQILKRRLFGPKYTRAKTDWHVVIIHFILLFSWNHLLLKKNYQID